MILINPQSENLRKLQGRTRYMPIGIPIGLGTLAGYLLLQKKFVEILDEQVEALTVDIIDSFCKKFSQVSIFGISCITVNINRGYEIAKNIKKTYNNAKVILGGMHPSVLPEEALKTGYVDIVVRKEGEITLSLLYDAIKNGKDYSQIRGISYIKNNHIIHNPSSQPVTLESLPPFPYSLFEKYRNKYNFGFISSSRGCPNDCIFCSQRIISNGIFRYASLNNVIAEIDILINKYEQKLITFIDDNFLGNRERVKELCNLIYKKNFHKKATFDCQARCDEVTEDILKTLKAANFRTINFGLETGSERLMAIISKNESIIKNMETVKLAKSYGFQISATFIMGLPTETPDERRETFKFARKLSLDHVRFKNATPYPGTKFYEMAQREGRLKTGKNWENLNATSILLQGFSNRQHLPYVPQGSTEKELRRDMLKANLYFLLRPKSIFKLFNDRFGPAGWFLLPERWYLSIKEWIWIARFLFKTTSFIFKK